MTCQVHIATSRPDEIGTRCRDYAAANVPDGFALTDDPEACDVFISVLYDTLLTPEFLEGRRCFNFHPGLLPDYRGAGAYSWAIINGESETGVTLHVIDQDIDHGPIIDRATTPISDCDTSHTLFVRSMDLLYELFRLWWPRLLSGDHPLRPNEGGHVYRRADLERQRDLTRFVRAFTFDGKPNAFFSDAAGTEHALEFQGRRRHDVESEYGQAIQRNWYKPPTTDPPSPPPPPPPPPRGFWKNPTEPLEREFES